MDIPTYVARRVMTVANNFGVAPKEQLQVDAGYNIDAPEFIPAGCSRKLTLAGNKAYGQRLIIREDA
jgi:hypothetical protein